MHINIFCHTCHCLLLPGVVTLLAQQSACYSWTISSCYYALFTSAWCCHSLGPTVSLLFMDHFFLLLCIVYFCLVLSLSWPNSQPVIHGPFLLATMHCLLLPGVVTLLAQQSACYSWTISSCYYALFTSAWCCHSLGPTVSLLFMDHFFLLLSCPVYYYKFPPMS